MLNKVDFFKQEDNESNLHRYYPDIYIQSLNKIIEVKSTYTYKIDFDKNLKKAKACKSLGFNFAFMIVDKNKLIEV